MDFAPQFTATAASSTEAVRPAPEPLGRIWLLRAGWALAVASVLLTLWAAAASVAATLELQRFVSGAVR